MMKRVTKWNDVITTPYWV